jgi:ribonuclease III
VLAAIVLDGGLPAAERFLRPFLERFVAESDPDAGEHNPKGRLQEIAQEREHLTPVYRTVSMEGPDHDSVFTVEVVLGERVLARGTGRSKGAAQRSAALAALESYLAAAPPVAEAATAEEEA